jgi:YD repeat-containing protein
VSVANRSLTVEDVLPVPAATYPTSITNAKNQTTTFSYDLGTGNVLSKTDPNNLTTAYAYDVFGRVTKEIKPYDSSSSPTTQYQYFADGVSPDSTRFKTKNK